MNKELLFISNRFEDYALPKEKIYLYKYFKSGPQRQFVRYFLLFGNTIHFRDHTGHDISRRWLRTLKYKLKKLEKLKTEARASFDLELLAKIESGKFKDF